VDAGLHHWENPFRKKKLGARANRTPRKKKGVKADNPSRKEHGPMEDEKKKKEKAFSGGRYGYSGRRH